MPPRAAILAGLTALLFVGCSSDPGLKPDAVPVKGVVQRPDGKPVAIVNRGRTLY